MTSRKKKARDHIGQMVIKKKTVWYLEKNRHPDICKTGQEHTIVIELLQQITLGKQVKDHLC